MKNVIGWSALLIATLASGGVFAAEDECEGARYFAPSDLNQAAPLAKPHPELAGLLHRARAGDAAGQQSAAAAYDAGYLVDKCPAKALFWYRKAAAAGNKPARQWLARHEFFERFRAGPECAGSSCPFGEDGNQPIELLADAGGHFTAPVTIKGITTDAIVDTGADLVSMGAALAKQLGISYEGGRPIMLRTANGTKSGYLVTLDVVRVGGIALENVVGSVSDVDQPLLLGMSFLGRLNVNINSGRMRLAKHEH